MKIAAIFTSLLMTSLSVSCTTLSVDNERVNQLQNHGVRKGDSKETLIAKVGQPLKAHRNAMATFKCGACGIEFKKCSTCDVPPEDHQNVNHIPIHKGCKGLGEVIYK